MAWQPMLSVKQDHSEHCCCTKKNQEWVCSADSARWPEPFSAEDVEEN